VYNINNFYNKFEIYDKKDDKKDDKNTNIDNIIKKNINNDEKYNDNLKKKYNEIKKNTNLLHSEFLKFELIFLKTCYNYYYLCNEIKKKIEEKHENLKIPLLKNFNNINGIGIQPAFVKKICDELFNLKYLYEYSNLMYNYYLYGLYWWIAANMKVFNEEIFTKEKIIKNFFSGKSIIDQKKYDEIINNKRKIFLEILDSLFKFEKFYKNNENIEKFRKNKLMSILFESSYNDSLSSTNILYTQLQEKITNNINVKRTITTEEYKLINVTIDRNCFLYCLIYALRNKIKEINDYPLYDKDIIQEFIDSSIMISDSPIKYDCDKLRNKIIDSVEFKVEYYKTKKEKNRDFFISLFSNVSSEIEQLKKMYNDDEQIFEYFKNNENYMLNDFIIKVVSQIFNCMFYVYSFINGNQPILRNITKYNNQPYSIIFYKDDKHYKLIEYNKNSLMTCEELPEELQMGQYCYYEPLIAEPLSNISMIGGGPIEYKLKEINEKYSKIEAKKNLNRRLSEEFKIKRDEYNKNISPEEKNKIKTEIKNKQNEIKNNNKQLVEYYEEIIKNNIELVKEYEKDEMNNLENIRKIETNINKYNNELNKLKINFHEKLSKNKNKKVYGIIVDLILYPGENPSMIEKQNYKCKKSFDDLKNEYCEVFGIGCSEKNKKNGGTMKNKIKNKKKYTIKNKII
jgi:DNA repair exonuclease SbcCD ATPase subunit